MSDEDRQLYHPDLTPEEERQRAIRDVLSDQAVRADVRRRPVSRPTTTWGRVGALVVLSLVAFYVWFAAPGWLEPPAPPGVPEEREDAGLRMAVFIQAQQVESFRRERGRLPDVLVETGEPLPGLHYERVDARTYRIRAFGPRRSLLYLSTDPLATFAGEADRRLGVLP